VFRKTITNIPSSSLNGEQQVFFQANVLFDSSLILFGFDMTTSALILLIFGALLFKLKNF